MTDPRQAGGPDEVERALEVDVPELVGGGPVVARTRCPNVARTVRPVAGEDPVDLAVRQRPHLRRRNSAAIRPLFQ